MKLSVDRMVMFSLAVMMIFSIFAANAFAENEESGLVVPGIESVPGISENTPDAPEMDASDEAFNNDKKVKVMSLLDIIQYGGIVGYLIILLSIISLGLILDYALTIRKNKILPPEDIARLEGLIKEGQFHEIEKVEKDRDSFLSKVTFAGLRESRLGYTAMIKAMEDTSEALTSGIARKIEHLNVIGNISPMMGLLGTVIGMLRCFNEIANVAGAIEPKQLAGGIFEALVTTCMGLIVAIPSLYCYAVFKNRIDEYTGEAALMAEHLVSSFKK